MSPLAANPVTPFVGEMGSPLPSGRLHCNPNGPVTPDMDAIMGDTFCFRVLPTDVIDMAWRQDRKHQEPAQASAKEPELRIEQQLRADREMQWGKERQSIEAE